MTDEGVVALKWFPGRNLVCSTLVWLVKIAFFAAFSIARAFVIEALANLT